MPVLAVIPARMESSRFPGKPLVDLCGRPMVVRVVDAVSRARRVDEVVVATDSEAIADAVRLHGGRAELTRRDHATGTDRVAEVAARHPAMDRVLNVQGDEPLVDPRALDALIEGFGVGDGFAMGTLVTPLREAERLDDPNAVKVALDDDGGARAFSRSAIPGAPPYLHIGVYLFAREFLLAYPGLPPSAREREERLEQLRVLDAGHRIRGVITSYESVNVDVPGDLARVRSLLDGRP